LIKKLQNEGYRVYALAPKDKYSEKLQEEDVEYHELKMDNKGTNPIEDIKLTYNLFKFYKKLNPNVILHYTIKPNIYGSIASRLLKIPIINNVTGLGTTFLNTGLINKITKQLYKIAFKNASMIFFQNNIDLDLFLKEKLINENQKKYHVLPGSGVDLKKYVPLKKEPKKNNNFTFLLISRMIKDKGIIEYLEASRLLNKKYKNIKYQLLGQLGVENKSAITREEIEEWVNEGIVEYLGSVDDVRENICNSDCIVLPSYREGTSKTLLESAAMGKVIVTTDVPGCNNIVEDGYNGFLCEAKNSEDLFLKMEKVYLLDNKDRKDMGKNSRIKMEKEFDEKIVIEKYLKTIKELV
jgi:glycosyltransferase involved in cell wall biosynthesis